MGEEFKTKDCLWEILVPKADNEGIEYGVSYHHAWDTVIKEMCGGLTILRSAKGTWLHKDKVYEERVIPVRILCTRAELEEILEFTRVFYSQIAVMAYKLSSEVIIYGAGED